MAASQRWIDDGEPYRHVGRVQARRASLRVACASLLLSVAPGCEAPPSPAAVSGAARAQPVPPAGMDEARPQATAAEAPPPAPASPPAETQPYPWAAPAPETWDARRLLWAWLDSDVEEAFLVQNPAEPIEGDLVTVAFRMAHFQDRCDARPRLRERAQTREGVTVIELQLDPAATPCEQTASFSRDGPARAIARVRLGELPAGRYRVVAGAHAREFAVRPSGADPGPLPLELRVRIAVVLERAPRGCDELGLLAAGFDDREDRPTTVRRLARAFPKLDDSARLAALHDTRRVDVVRTADGFRYTYSDSAGHDCKTTLYGGDALVTETAHGVRVKVGPATALPPAVDAPAPLTTFPAMQP